MAIREDELAARHMGINTTTAKLAAFALGASFSGLAGVAYAAKLASGLARSVSVQRQRAGALDARARRHGQHLGRDRGQLHALVHQRLPVAAVDESGARDRTSTSTSPITASCSTASILVAMMLFRPEGLIPSRQRRAELHAAQTIRRCSPKNRRIHAGPGGGLMALLLRLTDVRKTFGGLVAVNDALVRDRGGRDRRDDRAQRRRQVDGLQSDHRRLRADLGLDRSRRRARSAGCARTRSRRCGIARTFQNIRLFAFMSALDNVMTGRHSRMRASLVDSLLHTPRQRGEETRVRERARELLRFVRPRSAGRRLRAQPRRTGTSGGSRSRARSPPIRSCCCSTSRRRA